MSNAKQIQQTLESSNPAKSLYELIPKDRRKDFEAFAKQFGFTPEKKGDLFRK